MKLKLKLNPIYRKELILEARSLKLPALIIVYNMFLSIIGIYFFYTAFNASTTRYADGYASMISVYSTMIELEYIIVLFAVPAYAACMISREYEKNTMGVLLTTRMPLIKIILGKLWAVVTTVTVLVMSTLPVIAIVFCAGGISIINLLEYVLLIAVTTLFLGSIGILFSTILMRTVIATIASYTALLVLTLGTYGITSLAYSNISASKGADTLSVILLINPIFGIFKLIGDQTSTSDTFDSIVTNVCQSKVLVEHWLMISGIVQMIFSFGIVILTVWISKARHSGMPLGRRH